MFASGEGFGETTLMHSFVSSCLNLPSLMVQLVPNSCAGSSCDMFIDWPTRKYTILNAMKVESDGLVNNSKMHFFSLFLCCLQSMVDT